MIGKWLWLAMIGSHLLCYISDGSDGPCPIAAALMCASLHCIEKYSVYDNALIMDQDIGPKYSIRSIRPIPWKCVCLLFDIYNCHTGDAMNDCAWMTVHVKDISSRWSCHYSYTSYNNACITQSYCTRVSDDIRYSLYSMSLTKSSSGGGSWQQCPQWTVQSTMIRSRSTATPLPKHTPCMAWYFAL